MGPSTNVNVYLRRSGEHFFQSAKPFWFFVAGILLAFLVPHMTNMEPVERVLLSGYLFQIFAFGTILYRLNILLNRFLDYGFFGSIIEWFKGIPKIFETPTGSTVRVPPIKIEAEMIPPSVETGKEKSIENRIADLEKQQKEFQKKISELESNLTDQISEVKKSSSEQKKSVQSIKQLMLDLNIKGFPYEFVSLIWFILGLTLLTFSNKFVMLFGPS